MINRFTSRGRTVQLLGETKGPDHSNSFSILVGKNGTGKSTLLGELVEEYISILKYQERDRDRSQLAIEGISFPTKVIAVSLSPFDKFPIDRFGRVSAYSYLGVRDSPSTTLGLAYMSRVVSSLVLAAVHDPSQISELGRVLDFIGYRDELEIEFRSLGNTRFLEEVLETEDPEDLFANRHYRFSRRLNRDFFLNQNGTVSRRKFLRLKEIANAVINGEFIRGGFSLTLSPRGVDFKHFNSEEFLFIVQAGVFRLSDVKLKPKEKQDDFSLGTASSGEQSIILSILGIASQIRDDSLICIDEPEICLHPQWQEKYIELLTTTFERHKRCQFIIATHSPQVISRLPARNSFIINMETNELKRAQEFIDHSADFQLAQVFDSPGFKNEYLIRIAMTLFAKVTENKSFDDNDLETLEILNDQFANIRKEDPVHDLVLTLREFKELYG